MSLVARGLRDLFASEYKSFRISRLPAPFV